MIDPLSPFAIDLHDLDNAVELDGIRYRKLNPHTDFPAVCQLFETVFHLPMTPAYWQWKYQQGPDTGSFSIVVEHMETGRVIGHMGVLMLAGMHGGKALRMGQVCDVMLHPEYRSGIGPQSTYWRMNHALRQLAHAPRAQEQPPLYMYGFAGLRPAKLGERIGVYRRLQICTEYTTVPEAQGRQPLQQLWRRLNPWQLRAQAMQEAVALQSDALLDGIWQRHSHAVQQHAELRRTPHVIKNAAYLRWRYLMHPQQRLADAQPLYTLWLLLKGSQPMGWLVTRMQPQPIVVDSCLPPEWTQAALRALPMPSHESGSATGWLSWLAQSQAPAKPTPIHAMEVLGQPFHPDWPSPDFQPGDTDVF